MSGVPADLRDWWCQYCGTYYYVRPCIVCGGNAARTERFKLELGTKIEYLGAASRVGRDLYLHTALLIELYRRLKNYQPPKALRDWIGRESGYCIDAPDEIPAGGCFSQHVPDAEPDPDPYIVSQLCVTREERSDL